MRPDGGVALKPDPWRASGTPNVRPSIQVAFGVDSRAQADAFYAAVLAAGGGDNGPPGLRVYYPPDDFEALVLDPDGHPVEAVGHETG